MITTVHCVGRLKSIKGYYWCNRVTLASKQSDSKGSRSHLERNLHPDMEQKKVLWPKKKISVYKAILNMSWCLSLGFSCQPNFHSPVLESYGICGWEEDSIALATLLIERTQGKERYILPSSRTFQFGHFRVALGLRGRRWDAVSCKDSCASGENSCGSVSHYCLKEAMVLTQVVQLKRRKSNRKGNKTQSSLVSVVNWPINTERPQGVHRNLQGGRNY